MVDLLGGVRGDIRDDEVRVKVGRGRDDFNMELAEIDIIDIYAIPHLTLAHFLTHESIRKSVHLIMNRPAF